MEKTKLTPNALCKDQQNNHNNKSTNTTTTTSNNFRKLEVTKSDTRVREHCLRSFTSLVGPQKVRQNLTGKMMRIFEIEQCRMNVRIG